ncbi:hypothetical protein SERLA73DRAFT_190943 [Serpula lacrymans var. lacrymans S7.3]|uniref:Uncharacterized protein n=1 Tax=Serpula lacrymans var. lacrymans (strain S7.3) TaxID=936435 RepID=F8QGN6_SERL3|nr:hypothetical protein SERLA73DRAFT_190943 [Serpula lacrymans var. lacrymans S7.3]
MVDSPPSQPPELLDDVLMRPPASVAGDAEVTEEPLPEAPHVSDDDTRTKTPPPHKDVPPESPMRYTPPGTPSRGFCTPVKPNRSNQDSQSQFGKHVTYTSQPDVFQDSKPIINPTSEVTQSVPAPVVLTEEERLMTVEQWIQHEITLGTERLRADGLQQIALFKERAEEVRRCIAAL